MTSAPPDSALLGPLLSDAETAGLFTDEAAVGAMLEFEVTLAVVQERLDLIPEGCATAIASAARALAPDWDALGAASAADGHPVGALVRQLRRESGHAADYVHYGATAQDVVDTAFVIRLRKALDRFDERLREIESTLAGEARKQRKSVMAGRTRHQHAVPVSFGLKAAGWLVPLARHRQRLSELRPRVLAVQMGGAAGTLSVLGVRGIDVMEAVAQELGLEAPPMPWHSQRDSMAEVANWFSLVTSTLAKLGQDLAALSQTEIGEASDGSPGGSSAMPHKSNPVRSETLVAIGRANAGLLASVHQSAIHEHERSGSAWTLEWLALPRMAVLTGASLRLGLEVASSLETDSDRMRSNIESAGNLLLAEAAVLALAGHYSLAEARRIVKSASRKARTSDRDLIAILEGEESACLDWEAVRNPANWLGAADALIIRALRAVDA